MKKLFTFAAAILASVAMMAVEPTFESYDWDESGIAAVIGTHDGITIQAAGLGSNGNVSGHWYMPNNQNLKSSDSEWKYFGISATSRIDSVAILYCSNKKGDLTNIAWVAWGENVTPNQEVLAHGLTTGTSGDKKWDEAIWETIDLTDVEAYTVYTSRSIREFREIGGTSNIPNFGGGKTIDILGVRVWLSNATPSTDPVGQVTIAGPDACFVGQAAAYAATTDIKATEYKWFVNDVEQVDATAKNFAYTPEAEGTFNIVCKAKNTYNTDFVVSNTIALVASTRTALEQVDVTGATTWDWNDAATVNEIKLTATTTPAKNERCLLANLDGMNNNETFNSQALLFEGEYAMRVQSGMKLAQGQLLQFRTTVAGYLTVEYSNTGGRSAAEGETEGQESERRFITVNGNLIPGDAGSMVANAKTVVKDIPVAVGDVAISALRPYNTGHETEVQYVRFYKIIFSLTPSATAIENAEEAVKAVKFFQNGQLFIEKNGVIYNAQGAIVK